MQRGPFASPPRERMGIPLGGLDSSRSSKGGIPCSSAKSRLLVERFGRKSANPSIGETTKPRRSARQFASEAGDRGLSVRVPEADDAKPKSRLAGQHGSVPSLVGKKTRADRGSTWKGTAYRLAANNVNAFNRNRVFTRHNPQARGEGFVQ